ncbi:hypothetical protein IHV10_09545 [Fictibacillus sp. 5RED26]|uniref:O-antigen ligase family protein n=1 Tax=Fictibacillus sp. 5RED26 TaxID=2745876 RepID=UPI0018CDDC9B|nr:O-antigen ligase family protein [Fictibacillus sp. 5RED26]MBH0156611.1 hypothetical protein [Fictibacillus sp. 5RED26]
MRYSLFRTPLYKYTNIILVYLYVASNIQDFAYGNLKYIILIFIIFLGIISPRINYMRLTKENAIVIIGLTIIFVYYSMLGFLIDYETQILYSCFLSVIFISYIWTAGIYINNFKKYNQFVFQFFLITTVILIWNYVRDPVNITNFAVISNTFKIDDRVRNFFGFIHPNTAANVCFLSIVSSFYLTNYVLRKRGSKILLYLTNIFVFLIMLSTGSRGAITSTFVFYCTFFLIKYIYKVSTSVRYILSTLLVSLLCVCYLTFNGINTQKVLDYTNRYANWEYSINYLLDNKMFLLGVGLTNPGYFYTTGRYHFLSSDNWFVYIFITMGVIGVFLVIMLVSYILLKLLNEPKSVNIFLPTLTITLMYYSTMENIFYNPSGLTSLFYWTLLIPYFNRKFLKETI